MIDLRPYIAGIACCYKKSEHGEPLPRTLPLDTEIYTVDQVTELLRRERERCADTCIRVAEIAGDDGIQARACALSILALPDEELA